MLNVFYLFCHNAGEGKRRKRSARRSSWKDERGSSSVGRKLELLGTILSVRMGFSEQIDSILNGTELNMGGWLWEVSKCLNLLDPLNSSL